MKSRIRHYGWPVSPYTTKTRAYLHFKQIPFVDIIPSMLTLRFRIQKNVGAAIMPTLQLENGNWVQDSSDIIDTLEAIHPTPSIHPDGFKQKWFSYLMELYADEWLPMAALHYRWNTPENKEFALKEFERYGLPFLPRVIARRLVLPVANKMQSYLPALGVTLQTIPELELATHDLIAHLNTHLTHYPFLLGERPCLGDFALFGPLWAHLYRDPGTPPLFDNAPQVRLWFDRLLDPCPFPGDFLSNDVLPKTLLPLMRPIFQDQIPWIQTVQNAIDRYCVDHPQASRVPRSLGSAEFTIGQAKETRKLRTFVQWKYQRVWEHFQSAPPAQQQEITALIQALGYANPFDKEVTNPFDRRNFITVLANHSP